MFPHRWILTIISELLPMVTGIKNETVGLYVRASHLGLQSWG